MKTVYKWLTAVILAAFLLIPATAYADSSKIGATGAEQPQAYEISNPVSPKHATKQDTIFYSQSYHFGSRSASSRMGKSLFGSTGYGSYSGSRSSSGFRFGIGSHLFSFGAGWFLGRMLHPFGGYYGYGYHSFSLFHILFDLFIIWVIWRVIRRIFR